MPKIITLLTSFFSFLSFPLGIYLYRPVLGTDPGSNANGVGLGNSGTSKGREGKGNQVAA